MKLKLRYAAVALAGVVMGVCVWLVPGQANAFTVPASGPQEAPGGTYFVEGTVVNFCFPHNHTSSWLEWNSVVLGNCPPGDTQLSVVAHPDGLAVPTASPSP